jgi:hypothetical protein
MLRDENKDVLKVRVRKDLTLDYDVVNVRLSVGDEIEWYADEGEIIIDFDRTTHPFRDSCFRVVAGKPVRSGPPVGGVGYYEYYVRSEAMQMSADPGVSVKP